MSERRIENMRAFNRHVVQYVTALSLCTYVVRPAPAVTDEMGGGHPASGSVRLTMTRGQTALDAHVDVPGEVVTGLPFVATAVLERRGPLTPKSDVRRRVTSQWYRDSRGRTRRDLGCVPGRLSIRTGHRSATFIEDPVSGVSYTLIDAKKIAIRRPMPFVSQESHRIAERVTPPVRSDNRRVEPLGVKEVAGVTAEGTRTTTVHTARSDTEATATEIVAESWFSTELQMTVMTRFSDSRIGEVVFRFVEIRREEPPTELFRVPPGFSVVERNPELSSQLP
jgi:hypothetical protein